MTKAINKLFWHDGILVDVVFSINELGKSRAQLTALFYRDEQAAVRAGYRIECEGVLRFHSTFDTSELKKNMFAGNISHGYLKEDTLWVYVVDGLIEVRAKRFRLIKN